MKLYGCPNTRSFRPLWLLEELELDYGLERIEVFQGGGRKPEYLKLNPLGKVPTLKDGELVIYEAGAICMYLTEHYGPHLAPTINTAERALYYQWMFYVPATLEPPLMMIFLHEYLLPEAKRLPLLAEQGKKQFAKIAKVLDAQLSERRFIVDTQFSTADIMLAATLQWFPELLEPFAHLQDYCNRLLKRSAYQRAKSKELKFE